jgi:hypothetical protein
MTRYTKLTDLDIEWIGKWARKVNDDKVLRVIGRHFNASFVIGIDEQDYIIQVQNGKIEMVANEIHANMMGWQFALRAPASSWNKFIEPMPPPMYNDIWAMAHPLHGKMKIEGDTKIFWQNLRALTWMLALMRQV